MRHSHQCSSQRGYHQTNDNTNSLTAIVFSKVPLPAFQRSSGGCEGKFLKIHLYVTCHHY